MQRGGWAHVHTHANAARMPYMDENTHTHTHAQTFSPPHTDKELIKKQIVTLSFTFSPFCPLLLKSLMHVSWQHSDESKSMYVTPATMQR